MREHRFRAWNKNTKNMISHYGLCQMTEELSKIEVNPLNPNMLFIPINQSHVELMQYTGLDDIEKQNVYGGDLLEDGAEKIWEMKFGTHTRAIPLGASKRIKLVGHGWFLESIDNGDVVPATECQYIKVIGNIYENKDLLKGEE